MNSPLLIILLCTYDMFHPMFDIKFFNFINPILYLDLGLVLVIYGYSRVKDIVIRAESLSFETFSKLSVISDSLNDFFIP